LLEKDSPLSSEELMQALRSEIEAAAAELDLPEYFPLKKKGSDLPPISTSDDLNYLNREYSSLFSEPQFSSHRPVVGKALVLLKRLTLGQFWKRVVPMCLEREKQFVLRLVKHLNFASQATDAKIGQIFWQLIGKIDSEVQGVNERTDRVVAELDGTIRAIERNIYSQLQRQNALSEQQAHYSQQLESRLKTLEDVTKGLERVLNLGSFPSEKAVGSQEQKTTSLEYLLLENRYRGSEERISSSLEHYAELLRHAPGEVVDIGCGRGELVQLLLERGIACRGIDLDPAMVARCQQKGLPVTLANLFEFLSEQPERTLGAIVATQVIEHLSYPDLKRLLELGKKVLMPQGIIVLETINPQSLTALSSNFYRDPTHVFPIHPETLNFTLGLMGYEQGEICYLSPVPETAMLRPIPHDPELPARWIALVERINENISRLNQLLYGPQDFAVIARNP
jgi:O-antigen chain-terminating methyltransferase